MRLLIDILCLTTFIFVRNSHQQSQRLFRGDVCTTKDGKQSICTLFSECSTATEAVKQRKYPKICTFIENEPVICCPPAAGARPPATGSRPPTSGSYPSNQGGFVNSISMQAAIAKANQKCAEYGKTVLVEIDAPTLFGEESKEIINLCGRIEEALIVDGVDAKPREFPHMALIGYKERNVEWLCGGSLISENFVLSAAHCSKPVKGPARWVKIGDLDTSSDLDDADPQIIKIIQRFDHPEYSSTTLYNDISLFKLEKNIRFSAFVRPLCLSTKKDPDLLTALATGWGHTEFGGKGSSSLMKVRLDLVDQQTCNNYYRNLSGRQIPRGIIDSQICAGGRGSKDTCQGDSGGPLQSPINEPYCMYELIGLTSFGKQCGIGYPGVYSKISYFLPWIVQIVWPN